MTTWLYPPPPLDKEREEKGTEMGGDGKNRRERKKKGGEIDDREGERKSGQGL